MASAPENGNKCSIWSDSFSAETSLDNFAEFFVNFTGADGPFGAAAGDPWLHKQPILILVTLSAPLLAWTGVAVELVVMAVALMVLVVALMVLVDALMGLLVTLLVGALMVLVDALIQVAACCIGQNTLVTLEVSGTG